WGPWGRRSFCCTPWSGYRWAGWRPTARRKGSPARAAPRGRVRQRASGAAVGSGMTVGSGLAVGFGSLFVLRLGVGVGEASCAPAANSLIGDLFPATQRARALSIFMLGLPLGLGASYLVSGLITQATGSWRTSLFVAAAPGLVLGLLAFYLPE